MQEKVTVSIFGHDRTFDHKLFDFEDGVQWTWSDPMGLGMVDHHTYRVESITETRSRFIQTDQTKGGHIDLVNRFAASATKRVYEEFNSQLKAEAERRYAIQQASQS